MAIYLVENVFDKALLEFISTPEEKICIQTEKANIKMRQATSTKEIDEIIEHLGALAMFTNSCTNFPPQLVSPKPEIAYTPVKLRTGNILALPKLRRIPRV